MEIRTDMHLTYKGRIVWEQEWHSLGDKDTVDLKQGLEQVRGLRNEG